MVQSVDFVSSLAFCAFRSMLERNLNICFFLELELRFSPPCSDSLGHEERSDMGYPMAPASSVRINMTKQISDGEAS